MIIVPLHERHNRTQFDCGERSLNVYLQRYAGQHDRKGFGRTYVAVEADDLPHILGYYTISSGSISFETLPENVPHQPIPVVLLGRLAIDLKARGRGLGELLLVDALRRTLLLADSLGIYALVVDALHEQARAFHLKYEFKELLDNRLHLYLPLKLIRKLNWR